MTQPAATALHQAALAAAARGWRVFPLRPDNKRPTGHRQADCPRTGHCTDGHLTPEQRATTDPDLIRAAWSRRPYGIGIATGPSGLVVIDLDLPKDGSDAPDGATTFSALCERAGQPWPTTYTVRTRRGGWHLYFTNPHGVRLGLTSKKLGPNIDTRAWGGYVVAAGSTVGGKPYRLHHDTTPAPLPTWLHEALAPTPRPARPVPVPQARNASRYASAALRNETANVASAGDGVRNWTLLRAARALGRLVASGDLSRGEVQEALSGAALSGGGESQRYYDDVINRGLDWSIRNNPQRRPA
ncbi:hypothetical protein GCM10012287_46280 [Streptomyces daqingensis]|uniref:DNA primase/polymerase bifunctional N-terminal domain-containing protein n=1 Tax=Streptomyces daqingensis TaxID=1472640 RepID=A0ABQ2MPA6_9ACTN|nr:bifunctional DNA primase/polymerase [Streptomyces daqingensis]GGO55307.1 hypothetical protein GCM10012287_46280 [Streptomyces daqingensis]